MEDAVTPFIPTMHDLLSDSVDAPPSTHRSDLPITKRARRQDSCSNLNVADTPRSSESSRVSQEPDMPCRDSQFYLADGSCVLRVGNTLFNVRFTFLSRKT